MQQVADPIPGGMWHVACGSCLRHYAFAMAKWIRVYSSFPCAAAHASEIYANALQFVPRFASLPSLSPLFPSLFLSLWRLAQLPERWDPVTCCGIQLNSIVPVTLAQAADQVDGRTRDARSSSRSRGSGSGDGSSGGSSGWCKLKLKSDWNWNVPRVV